MRAFFRCIVLTCILAFAIMAFSCSTDAADAIEKVIEEDEESLGCPSIGLMECFIDPDGNNIHIYEDGKLYLQKNGACSFELDYFDPDFLTQNYVTDANGTFLIDGDTMVAVKNEFEGNFDSKEDLIELFETDPNGEDFYWTGMTLQSPSAKEVSDYVALAKCILEGSCDFLDNKIEIVQDPMNSNNKVLKFISVAPTADMVTSKCSITSVLGYFQKGDDLWYEADYFIESGMPFTLVDFESSYFYKSPGPRIIIKNGKLALDNKFGEKLQIIPPDGVPVPIGSWFSLKVHLKFSNTDNGVIELWQDGQLLVSTTGINLQTANGLQNILEVGISATQESAVLLLDNIRISSSEL